MKQLNTISCILICLMSSSCNERIDEKNNKAITSDVFIIELIKIKNENKQFKDMEELCESKTHFKKSKNKHLIPKHLSVEELILGEIDFPPWPLQTNYFAIEKEGVTRLVLSLDQYHTRNITPHPSIAPRITINQFQDHSDGSITLGDGFVIKGSKWNEYLKSLLLDNSK